MRKKVVDSRKKDAKKPPGRPLGWRKKSALRHTMMVRMTDEMWLWVVDNANKAGLNASEIVRQTVEDRMNGKMEG